MDKRPEIDPLKLAYDNAGIAPWRQNLSQNVVRGYVGFWGFIGNYWLTILNLLNAAIIGAAFATPFLLLAGWDTPASWLFGLFHYVCVQNPNHTFYINDKPMCICQRCLAIYSGLFVAGVLFHFVRKRLTAPNFWLFVVVFCLPIGIDGFTQLFGWRESTPELRLFTGSWFGVGAVWLLYPLCQERFSRLSRWAARELQADA